MPASNPIHVLEYSRDMREYFTSLSMDVKKDHHITLMQSGESDNVACDDTIFVGEDIFFIHAVSDGRFYVTTCFTNPPETPEEREDMYRQMVENGEEAIAALNNGEDPFQLPSIQPKNYLGCYVDTCEAAVTLAISWLSRPISELPKDYHPPIQTPR
jgi:hypothetical protein